MRHFRFVLFVVMSLIVLLSAGVVLAQDTQPVESGAWATVWTVATSATVIAVLVFLVNLGLAKLKEQKPEWAKALDAIGGYAIAGVKWAEKAIPDDTPNKAMLRLDQALRYILVVADASGKPLADAAIAKEINNLYPAAVREKLEALGVTEDTLRQAIIRVHAALESKAAL